MFKIHTIIQTDICCPEVKQIWRASGYSPGLLTFICLTLFSCHLFGGGQLLDHNSLCEHVKAVVSSRILQHVNWLKVNKPNVMNEEPALLLPGGLYSNEAVEGDKLQWKLC